MDADAVKRAQTALRILVAKAVGLQEAYNVAGKKLAAANDAVSQAIANLANAEKAQLLNKNK